MYTYLHAIQVFLELRHMEFDLIEHSTVNNVSGAWPVFEVAEAIVRSFRHTTCGILRIRGWKLGGTLSDCLPPRDTRAGHTTAIQNRPLGLCAHTRAFVAGFADWGAPVAAHCTRRATNGPLAKRL